MAACIIDNNECPDEFFGGCNILCGDGLDEQFGTCDLHPLCSPACRRDFDDLFCEFDEICDKRCGDGSNPFVGLCVEDIDCIEIELPVQVYIYYILTITCILCCIFAPIYYFCCKSKKNITEVDNTPYKPEGYVNIGTNKQHNFQSQGYAPMALAQPITQSQNGKVQLPL